MAQRASRDRLLAAVLFTDIAGSTHLSEELGDRRWKAVLERHHRIVRALLKRFGGRELDTAGDGFFASFREPASAIACACAAAEDVRQLGIEIRAGVHFGECERAGPKLAGITVVIGARIAGLGEAGDVLVSDTAAQLARGADFGFTDRGLHRLKGVEDEWRVMAVTSVEGMPRAPVLLPSEARARRDRIRVEDGRRRSNPRVAIPAVAAALISALILTIVILGRAEPLLPGPGSLARIGSSGDTFDRAIPLGPQAVPADVAFGLGKLWVANVTTNTLAAVDPTSGVVRSLGTRSTPTGIAFAEEMIWVTFGFSSDVSQRIGMLDPDGAVLDQAPFPVPDGSYPIAAGGHRLWVADPLGSTITSYDLETRKESSIQLPDGSGPVDLALFERGTTMTVWAASGREASVIRIDASDPRSSERYGTGVDIPTALAVDREGTAWVVSQERNALLAIDPTGTTRISTTLGEGCNQPVDVATSSGSVWVSCALSRTVVRLDPGNGSIVSVLRVGGTPGPIAVDGEGAVWVAIQEI